MGDNFNKRDIANNHQKAEPISNPFFEAVNQAIEKKNLAVIAQKRKEEEAASKAEFAHIAAQKKKEEEEVRKRKDRLKALESAEEILSNDIRLAISKIHPLNLTRDGSIEFGTTAFEWFLENEELVLQDSSETFVAWGTTKSTRRGVFIDIAKDKGRIYRDFTIHSPYTFCVTTRSFVGLVDGSAIASVMIHNFDTKVQLAEFKAAGKVNTLAISGDGQIVAAGCENSILQVHHLENGSREFHLHNGPITQAIFSPSNQHIASISSQSGIKILNVISGDTDYSFKPDKGWITAIAYSTDGGILAYAIGRNVILWNLEKGEVASSQVAFNHIVRRIIQTKYRSQFLVCTHEGHFLVDFTPPHKFIRHWRNKLRNRPTPIAISNDNAFIVQIINWAHSELVLEYLDDGRTRKTLKKWNQYNPPENFDNAIIVSGGFSFVDKKLHRTYSRILQDLRNLGWNLETRDALTFQLSWSAS